MSTFYLLPDDEQTIPPRHDRRLRGQKAPFKPREVWAIRAMLQIQGRMRELALFNLAIDSKLRGCDLVTLRVRDILPCCLSITPSPIDAPAQAQAVRDWVSIFTNTKATQQDVCL